MSDWNDAIEKAATQIDCGGKGFCPEQRMKDESCILTVTGGRCPHEQAEEIRSLKRPSEQEGDKDIEQIKRDTFERILKSRKVWIVEEGGADFTVHAWTNDGVAPPSVYPTLRKAAARILQLFRIGVVAPQTWPEEVCIGSVTTHPTRPSEQEGGEYAKEDWVMVLRKTLQEFSTALPNIAMLIDGKRTETNCYWTEWDQKTRESVIALTRTLDKILAAAPSTEKAEGER